MSKSGVLREYEHVQGSVIFPCSPLVLVSEYVKSQVIDNSKLYVEIISK